MKGNIFIKRPVMAISISVLIFAIGLISLFTLPVEQYPDIAPPTVYGGEYQRCGKHDLHDLDGYQ